MSSPPLGSEDGTDGDIMSSRSQQGDIMASRNQGDVMAHQRRQGDYMAKDETGSSSSSRKHGDVVTRDQGDVMDSSLRSVERARLGSMDSDHRSGIMSDNISEPSPRSWQSASLPVGTPESQGRDVISRGQQGDVMGSRSHQGDVLSSRRSSSDQRTTEIIAHLRSQLQASNDLNEALRRELELYETLKPTSPPPHNPAAGSTDSGLAGMTLEEHLAEIRALRAKLEESIRHNDRLRAALEELLKQESTAGKNS